MSSLCGARICRIGGNTVVLKVNMSLECSTFKSSAPISKSKQVGVYFRAGCKDLVSVSTIFGWYNHIFRQSTRMSYFFGDTCSGVRYGDVKMTHWRLFQGDISRFSYILLGLIDTCYICYMPILRQLSHIFGWHLFRKSIKLA